MKTTPENFYTLPVLPLRGVVFFPGMTLGFEVESRKDLIAVRSAVNSENRRVILLLQKDVTNDDPGFDDLYDVGVVGEIKQILKIPRTDNLHIVLEGLFRVHISSALRERPSLRAVAERLFDTLPFDVRDDYVYTLSRSLKRFFEDYAEAIQSLDREFVFRVSGEKTLADLTDVIAANCDFPPEDKQAILEQTDIVGRAELLCNVLSRETELLKLENKIEDKVQDRMDKNQRDYYLREQIKAISGELGEEDNTVAESIRFRDKIQALPIDEKSKKKLLDECTRFGKTSPGSPEANVARAYLERVIALPFGVYTEDSLDIDKARKILERDHYGLQEVKERILELIAVKRLAPDANAQILCLVGPPGVGKTSIAKSLAEALGRKYVRISLGGVHDEAEIRGHRRTYIGAMPGRIITAIEQAETANPLILLDEVDKLGDDYKGDPASALLEVLDGEQNNTFTDHYIDVPFDLSKVLFITTANDESRIPGPLYDRMDVIELTSYTSEDKFSIAKKHLIPRQLKNLGITNKTLVFTDAAIRAMIADYTREAGVRSLDRAIAKVLRKAAVKIADGCTEKIRVTPDTLAEYLGAPKYRGKEFDFNDMVGVANGLAWTSVGGVMMQIETAVPAGTGKLELTGSLGDVMKESAKAAITYVRSRSDELGVDPDFYKTCDIHIHVPEGATPKDGPSAGVTMTTSLVSALTGIPAVKDVAMTGEITLRGRVLPIGGLREKATAAYRNKMKTVIIPEDNLPDLEKVNDTVKSHLEFIPVTSLDEVLEIALDRPKHVGSARRDAKKNAPPTKRSERESGVYCAEE